MIENLRKNGSFVQRRKMYLEYPAYHLNSKVPIDWATDSSNNMQKNPLRSNKEQEQIYMEYLYNQRMTRKMIDKYHANFDTFRVIPNENTLQNDRDILTQQLEQFNTSRQMSPNRDTYNNPQQSLNQYSSLKELPNHKKEDALKISREIQYSNKQVNQSRQKANSANKNTKEYSSPYAKYKDPYMAQKEFNNDLMQQYRRYAERPPQCPQNHPMRNLLPDKLQEFLREKEVVQRRSKLRASLSHSRKEVLNNLY